MFGVVLWSDTNDQKAVIWCEDHGDLAFYRQPEDGAEISLDAGDLVQFDMTTDRHLQFAHNPRLVSEGVCAGLADVLGQISMSGQDRAQDQHQATAEIIPFGAAARRAGRDCAPGSWAHSA